MQLVGVARDGVQALELVAGTEPDVALMDLRMPHLDGIETTRRIVASSTVQVLALTSWSDDELFHAALAAGVSGFLLKTATREEIVHAVRQVNGGESILSPGLVTRVLSRYRASLAPDPGVDNLSDREISLLRLVGEGLSNDEIAMRLFLSPASVKTYVSRLLSRTGCRDRAQLVRLAFLAKLVHH